MTYETDVSFAKKHSEEMDRKVLIESKNTATHWRLDPEDVDDFFVGRNREFYRVFHLDALDSRVDISEARSTLRKAIDYLQYWTEPPAAIKQIIAEVHQLRAAFTGTPICGHCGSSEVDEEEDAGWDIWPGGEERQHKQTCRDCGAVRFRCDVYEFKRGHYETLGKWFEPEHSRYI